VEERTNDGTAANEMTSEAWQVGASVVVYGGKPSFKGVKVDRALDPETGGLGAFEVGARYGELHISSDVYRAGHADSAASADRASAWAGMVAWHFATRVKAQAHYERTTFNRGAPGGDRPTEGVLITRLQVAF
jgi:phosphate-selective porin OprO and OprP